MLRSLPVLVLAAAGGAQTAKPATLLLTGARVLATDGESFLDDRAVLVRDGRIEAIGPPTALPAAPDAERLDLAGACLVPGLIDLHTHFLLHPYDEASWDDQVLKEPLELRTVRAVVHAAATLRAGFTTVRELGTEGAGFADVALRRAIDEGIVPGPRMLCTTRALVATGCYGPTGFDPRFDLDLPKGAQVADGIDGVRRAVREQIAAGADWIKVYADYRRRPGGPSVPSYSPDELRAIVDEAASAGVPVAAHAVTDAAIRRAVDAGVRTIDHGYQVSAETLAVMRERGVALCPTLAANEAVVRYAGRSPAAARRLNVARASFRRALEAGVVIACGSDAGVFRHGDNVHELELMVEYGMTPARALHAATDVAAAVLGMGGELGRIAPGAHADLVAVDGDPLADVAALRRVRAVVARGAVVARE